MGMSIHQTYIGLCVDALELPEFTRDETRESHHRVFSFSSKFGPIPLVAHSIPFDSR